MMYWCWNFYAHHCFKCVHEVRCISLCVWVCPPLVTEPQARKWAFLSLRGAKLTEHEGDHKAPNCLLIPAGSVANHYTSSSHLFSTFLLLFFSLYTPPLLLIAPPHLWPRSLTSPCASLLLFCVNVTVCVCVFGSEDECGCDEKKRASVRMLGRACSENYLAWPLNLLSSQKKELCFPPFAVSLHHSLTQRRGGVALQRCNTAALRRGSTACCQPPYEEQSPVSPQVSLTGSKNVPLFQLQHSIPPKKE